MMYSSMNAWIHPSLILMLGSFLLPFLKGKVRAAWLLFIPLFVLAGIALTGNGTYGAVDFLGCCLTFGRFDSLSRLFALIMILMCFIGTLFSLQVKNTVEHIAAWFYNAGSLGVILAGDYLVLFVFWEIMAFSSVILVWASHTQKSIEAGFRYILIHGLGGVILLTGIAIHVTACNGDLSFISLSNAPLQVGEWLILFGFLLNAAAPPVHAWLPDAYSSATPTGAVFLSAFTTKTAVYALIRGFSGLPLLLPLGTFMILLGIFYAMLQNDIRKLLGYHIISQVGYMIAAIGIGTELAVCGACAHAVVHILYKGLLFMGAGSILHVTGTSKFTNLGGLRKKMPLTFACTTIGGLSISACVGFAGFVSKSMIASSAMETDHFIPWMIMMFAASGTFLSTTLKFIHHIWMDSVDAREIDSRKISDPSWNMQLAMVIASFLCVFFGTAGYPLLYKMLPYSISFDPYSTHIILETIELLLGTLLAFMILIPFLEPKRRVSYDVDALYCGVTRSAVSMFSAIHAKINQFDWQPVLHCLVECGKNILLRPAQVATGRKYNSFESMENKKFPVSFQLSVYLLALILFLLYLCV